MNFFNFRPLPRFSPYMYYNYERNIQGIGFQPNLKLCHNNSRLSFAYSPTFRYDYLQHKYPILGGSKIDEKGLILNQHFLLLWETKKNNIYFRHQKIGIGYSLFNPKYESVEFYDPRFGKKFNVPIHFSAITLRYEWPIKRHLELSSHAHYIHNYFPNTPYSPQLKYVFYSLSMSYVFNIGKNEKE